MRLPQVSRCFAYASESSRQRSMIPSVIGTIDDIPATAAYRRHVAVRLVQRFLEELQSR